jgi:hypothetical protein
MGMAKSRMSREVHVRFREGLGVQVPRATRLVILCGSQRAGERILASIKKFIENGMMLTVNVAKSAVRKLKAKE